MKRERQTERFKVHLCGGVRLKAEDDEDEDGDGVEEDAGPQRDVVLSGVADGAHDQEEDGTRGDDAGRQQKQLVYDVQHGDVLVVLRRVLPVSQQVDDVGHGGRRPASSLVVELVEAFRSEGVGVGGGAVFHTVALLQQQRAQPAVLAWEHRTRRQRLKRVLIVCTAVITVFKHEGNGRNVC